MEIAMTIKMPCNIAALLSKRTASGLGWFYFIQGFLKKGIMNGS